MFSKILLITIDCLRSDHISYNGYRRNITPTIDNLAENGSNFFNVFSNGPHTHYSFPSILTSEYPLMYNGPKITSNKMTLAEKLKKMGFKTVGLNSNPFLSKYFGYNRGFDEFNDFIEKNKNSFNFGIQLKKIFWNKKNIYKIFQIIDRYLAIKKINKPFITAEELTDNLLKYIEGNKKKNLFLWAHYMDAHYPYIPDKEQMRILNFKNISDIKKTFLFSKMLNEPDNVTTEEIQILINLYDAQINKIDSQISRILNYLKENELINETLIVITADHGEEFKEHGDFTHRVDRNKATLNNTHLHVPLIIYNKNNNYKDVKNSVSLIDLTPTIIDIIGSEPEKTFKGKSLLPLMKYYEERNRSFFSEHEYQDGEIVGNIKKRRKKAIAYISYPFKLIYYENDNQYQLYNIKKDAFEKNRIENISRYQDIFNIMKKQIINHLNEIEKSKIELRVKQIKSSI